MRRTPNANKKERRRRCCQIPARRPPIEGKGGIGRIWGERTNVSRVNEITRIPVGHEYGNSGMRVIEHDDWYGNVDRIPDEGGHGTLGEASRLLYDFTPVDRAHGSPCVKVNRFIDEVHAAVAEQDIHAARMLAARGGRPGRESYRTAAAACSVIHTRQIHLGHIRFVGAPPAQFVRTGAIGRRPGKNDRIARLGGPKISPQISRGPH